MGEKRDPRVDWAPGDCFRKGNVFAIVQYSGPEFSGVRSEYPTDFADWVKDAEVLHVAD